MNPDQRSLYIWSGILAGLLLVGWLVLDARGESSDKSTAEALRLVKRYDESHPAGGLSANETRAKLKDIRVQQDGSLSESESALAPTLPTDPQDFTNDDLNAAEGTFREVVSYLEHKAERQNVKISELPMKKGLDNTAAVRRQQLAQLYLVRGILDSCIDAGVSAVTNISLNGNPFTDPSDRFAIFLCDVTFEGTWKNVSQMVDDLARRQQRKGYGIRELQIDQREDGSQLIKLTASLITLNQPEWGLKQEGVKGGAKPPRPIQKKAQSTDRDGGN